MLDKILTFDEIGDRLLEGVITPDEAETLSRNAQRDVLGISRDDYSVRVVEEEGELKVLDCLENCLAYAFISSRGSILFIDWVQSYVEGQGYLEMLIDRAERIARKQRARAIMLEVDQTNERAYRAFSWNGFYEIPTQENISDNTDRVLMQRDIIGRA